MSRLRPPDASRVEPAESELGVLGIEEGLMFSHYPAKLHILELQPAWEQNNRQRDLTISTRSFTILCNVPSSDICSSSSSFQTLFVCSDMSYLLNGFLSFKHWFPLRKCSTMTQTWQDGYRKSHNAHTVSGTCFTKDICKRCRLVKPKPLLCQRERWCLYTSQCNTKQFNSSTSYVLQNDPTAESTPPWMITFMQEDLLQDCWMRLLWISEVLFAF